MERFDTRAAEACLAMLGEKAERVEFPAGRSRRSVRVHLPGRAVIATCRRSRARAANEVRVLRALGAAGAPVPAVLAWRDGWLIQEDLGGTRLSAAMADAGRDDVERALDAALAALARCHEAGRAAGLGKGAATLGAATDWRATFATMPGRIGDATGVAPPAIDSARLADGVLPRTVAFVKWDARPGNAIVRDTGRVAWFDWEHAGVRSPLDDVAWLLGDEYVGDLPGIEHALLARHLAAFAGDLDDDAARDYLMTVLCLHACVRLALILSYRLRDGRWWDRRQTIREDRVGVDIGYALTLCAKAGRWARETRLTRPLSPWFADVAERIRANG